VIRKRDGISEGSITAILAVLCVAFGCGKRQAAEETLQKDDSFSVESAVGAFSEAVRLDSGHAEPHYSRAIAHQTKGELDEAIADFTEAIRLKPDFAKAYNNRGLAYRHTGDFDKAITEFAEAIRLDAKNPKVYVNRGATFHSKGDLEKAISDYTEAITSRPQHLRVVGWMEGFSP
jgi:tetratricopeptide (TPR) repeat protein